MRLFGLRIITRRTLTTDDLFSWFNSFCRNNPGYLCNSGANLLNCLAAAEHAVRFASDHRCVPLFCWLMAGKKWHMLTLADVEAARARLRRYYRRFPHSPYAAMLAEALSA